MDQPVHNLRASLETARLNAVRELASKNGAPASEALQKLAILQTALTAVREEIAAHEVKVGGGAEKPLE